MRGSEVEEWPEVVLEEDSCLTKRGGASIVDLTSREG